MTSKDDWCKEVATFRAALQAKFQIILSGIYPTKETLLLTTWRGMCVPARWLIPLTRDATFWILQGRQTLHFWPFQTAREYRPRSSGSKRCLSRCRILCSQEDDTRHTWLVQSRRWPRTTPTRGSTNWRPCPGECSARSQEIRHRGLYRREREELQTRRDQTPRPTLRSVCPKPCRIALTPIKATCASASSTSEASLRMRLKPLQGA